MKKFWFLVGGIILLAILLHLPYGTPASQVAGVSTTVTKTPTPTNAPTPTPTLSPTPTIFVQPPTATPAQYIAPTTSNTSSGLSNDNYYTNSDGTSVHSPAYSNSVPAGATAICVDGTYSFSLHRSSTCSHHGGVAQWL